PQRPSPNKSTRIKVGAAELWAGRTTPCTKRLYCSCCTLEEIRFGGKVMAHLIFASLVVVIVANVTAVIVIAATLTRLRRMTIDRAIQGIAWRSPGGD